MDILVDFQLAASIVGFISGIAATIAVAVLRNQLQQAERNLRGLTSRYCYEEMGALLGTLVEQPHLRPYIYEGATLPTDGVLRQQVLALTARYADFFEAILAQRALGNMSSTEYEQVWEPFITSMTGRCSLIRSYVLDHPHWYSGRLSSLASSVSPQLDDLAGGPPARQE